MAWANYHSTIRKLAILAIILVIFLMSLKITQNKETSQDFLSLAREQDFWDDWIRNFGDPKCPLVPFLWASNKNSLNIVNEKLTAISKASDSFVLIVKVNINDRIFEVISLAKKENWEQTKWEDMGKDGLNESFATGIPVHEDDLRCLSSKSIFVDASDWNVFDADSIYVFLRYNGRCCRSAIYNPEFDSVMKHRDPMVASLMSLFHSAGMADQRRR